MRKIILFIITVFLLFAMCACDSDTIELMANGIYQMTEIASQGNSYKYENCTLVIRDNADLITDEEESDIVNSVSKYCEQSKCDILIMTINGGGLSTLSPGQTYANAYLPKNSENWIAITYDAPKNTYYLYYDGDIAQSAIGGSSGDFILSEANGYFRHEEYAKGLGYIAAKSLERVVSSQE